jgi:hypothetical protein
VRGYGGSKGLVGGTLGGWIQGGCSLSSGCCEAGHTFLGCGEGGPSVQTIISRSPSLEGFAVMWIDLKG